MSTAPLRVDTRGAATQAAIPTAVVSQTATAVLAAAGVSGTSTVTGVTGTAVTLRDIVGNPQSFYFTALGAAPRFNGFALSRGWRDAQTNADHVGRTISEALNPKELTANKVRELIEGELETLQPSEWGEISKEPDRDAKMYDQSFQMARSVFDAYLTGSFLAVGHTDGRPFDFMDRPANFSTLNDSDPDVARDGGWVDLGLALGEVPTAAKIGLRYLHQEINDLLLRLPQPTTTESDAPTSATETSTANANDGRGHLSLGDRDAHQRAVAAASRMRITQTATISTAQLACRELKSLAQNCSKSQEEFQNLNDAQRAALFIHQALKILRTFHHQESAPVPLTADAFRSQMESLPGIASPRNERDEKKSAFHTGDLEWKRCREEVGDIVDGLLDISMGQFDVLRLIHYGETLKREAVACIGALQTYDQTPTLLAVRNATTGLRSAGSTVTALAAGFGASTFMTRFSAQHPTLAAIGTGAIFALGLVAAPATQQFYAAHRLGSALAHLEALAQAVREKAAEVERLKRQKSRNAALDFIAKIVRDRGLPEGFDPNQMAPKSSLADTVLDGLTNPKT